MRGTRPMSFSLSDDENTPNHGTNASVRPPSPRSGVNGKKVRNAFDELKKGATSQAAAGLTDSSKPGKSIYVEAEADESDDDFGFSTKKKGDNQAEESEDEDAPVEGLVDDAKMDDDTLAADLVLEKVKYAISDTLFRHES